MNKPKWAAAVARGCGLLAVLALLGAWITQVMGQPLLSMTQQHLFNEAIVLSLFAIAGLLDSIVHSRTIEKDSL